MKTEQDDLKGIERSRWLDKNILKRRIGVNTKIRVGLLGIALGMAATALSATFLAKVNTPLMTAFIALGFCICVASMVALVIAVTQENKLDFLRKLLQGVKENGIFFLHDPLLDALTLEQKTMLCGKLTASQNLSQYELIDHIALVKKSLYLDGARLQELVKTSKFGEKTRISEDMLVVVESDTRLMSDRQKDALEQSPHYYEDVQKATAYKDKFIERDHKKIAEANKILTKLIPVPLLSGLAVVAVLVVLGIFMGETYFYAAAGVFPTCFLSTVLLNFVTEQRKKRLKLITDITRKLKKNETVAFNDDCFNGLSLEHRIMIAEKLISCGKVGAKRVVGDLGVAAAKDKAAESKLRALYAPQFKDDAHVIVIGETSTNCVNCGAVLRENAQFCGFCGKRVERRDKN